MHCLGHFGIHEDVDEVHLRDHIQLQLAKRGLLLELTIVFSSLRCFKNRKPITLQPVRKKNAFKNKTRCKTTFLRYKYKKKAFTRSWASHFPGKEAFVHKEWIFCPRNCISQLHRKIGPPKVDLQTHDIPPSHGVLVSRDPPQWQVPHFFGCPKLSLFKI